MTTEASNVINLTSTSLFSQEALYVTKQSHPVVMAAHISYCGWWEVSLFMMQIQSPKESAVVVIINRPGWTIKAPTTIEKYWTFSHVRL